jgi:hypothetical protein
MHGEEAMKKIGEVYTPSGAKIAEVHSSPGGPSAETVASGIFGGIALLFWLSQQFRKLLMRPLLTCVPPYRHYIERKVQNMKPLEKGRVIGGMYAREAAFLEEQLARSRPAGATTSPP